MQVFDLSVHPVLLIADWHIASNLPERGQISFLAADAAESSIRPARRMASANTTPVSIIPGVMRKSKVNSLKVTKLPIPLVKLLSGKTSRHPMKAALAN